MMGVATVVGVSAVAGFRAAAAPPAASPAVDITLQKRIDRAGASVAISSDGSAVFRPDGDVIAITSADGAAAVMFGCQCAAERARAVAVSSDGDTMVVGVPDANEVVIMRRKRPNWFEHQVIRDPSAGFGAHVTLSPDGQRLFVSSYEGWAVFSMMGDMFSKVRCSEAPTVAAGSNRDVTWVASAGSGRLDVVRAVGNRGDVAWEARVDSDRVMTLALDDSGDTAFVAYTAADIVVFARSGRSANVVETLRNTIDGFGRAVVISKHVCFIGSPYEDRVYVYAVDTLPKLTYMTTLCPDEGGLGSEFGAQISVSDDALAVLAPGYGQNERGAVFVFKVAPISPVPIANAAR
jgi:hypothetical protein